MDASSLWTPRNFTCAICELAKPRGTRQFRGDQYHHAVRAGDCRARSDRLAEPRWTWCQPAHRSTRSVALAIRLEIDSYPSLLGHVFRLAMWHRALMRRGL